MKIVVIIACILLAGCTQNACTLEAKLCADGSAVGRNSDNNCEFDPCPNDISWDDAVKILNSGVVTQVVQTHSLDVALMVKNGTTYTTKEPAIDEIFSEIEKCDKCMGIGLITE